MIRLTSELQDDEGEVFITAVAGSPFQVLGRRDATGELFVGSTVWPQPGARDIRELKLNLDWRPHILEGEEAEQLLQEVLEDGRYLPDAGNREGE